MTLAFLLIVLYGVVSGYKEIIHLSHE